MTIFDLRRLAPATLAVLAGCAQVSNAQNVSLARAVMPETHSLHRPSLGSGKVQHVVIFFRRTAAPTTFSTDYPELIPSSKGSTQPALQ